jgi:hypothetical protein
MYELILPDLPLGISIQYYIQLIYTFIFGVKETITDVFSTALVVRDSGALIVRETYGTSVMIFRTILDGILVPIVKILIRFIETTSIILTSLFTKIYSLATNTNGIFSSVTIYKEKTNTLFTTGLYIVGFYICFKLLTKPLVKKIK